MRTLTGHKVNGLNEALEITVVDEPGAGGACHEYRIDLLDNVARPGDQPATKPLSVTLQFQNGPVKDAGFNGITQEVLLEIVADRLRSFQAGPHAGRENAVALTHLETAQMWLQKRTRDRMARGVEGTHAQ